MKPKSPNPYLINNQNLVDRNRIIDKPRHVWQYVGKIQRVSLAKR